MTIVSYLLIILLLAVFMVLIAGIMLMGVGGKANVKYGNKLMAARVCLQGMALVTVAMMYFFAAK